jgi:hypothetical protein
VVDGDGVVVYITFPVVFADNGTKGTNGGHGGCIHAVYI